MSETTTKEVLFQKLEAADKKTGGTGKPILV